jgi:hypothetical protein
MAKTRHSGRMFGQKTARKRQKRGSEDKNLPVQEIMSKTQNTPRLAQNAPFAHLGAPRGCQSVVLCSYGQNQALRAHIWAEQTARKGPNRDRIRISATEFYIG